MRLLHVEVECREIPAIMTDGVVLDASRWCSAWNGEEFMAERLHSLRAAIPTFIEIEDHGRIGLCVKASSHVATAIAGHCIADDVSERVWQLEREGQEWPRGIPD